MGLASLFGKEGIRANPCFHTHLKGLSEFGDAINFEDNAFIQNLRCALLGVWDDAALDAMQMDDVFDTAMDEELGEWARKWKDRKLTSEERDEMTKQLFRAGLGIEDGPCHRDWFYSFCRNQWVQHGEVHHCGGCEECKSWRDWHCIACNFCTEGLDTKCVRCGGVSRSYGAAPH